MCELPGAATIVPGVTVAFIRFRGASTGENIVFREEQAANKSRLATTMNMDHLI